MYSFTPVSAANLFKYEERTGSSVESPGEVPMRSFKVSESLERVDAKALYP